VAAPSLAVTISRAAEVLGEHEELLWDLATEMEPDCLWIHDTNDEQTVVFTPDGLDYLRSLIREYRRNRPPPGP
jgi:hypothetical protein